MSFPRYAKYKASGVDWLGEVPEHWEVCRARQLGRFTSSGIDKKLVDGEQRVQMFNYLDVYRSESKVLKQCEELMWTTAPAEKVRDHSVRVGDILLTPSSETNDDIGHAAFISECGESVVYSYHLIRFRTEAEALAPFITYCFNALPIRSYFESVCTGTTRMVLVREDFQNAPFALPPLPEQTAIAAFLDRETGKIDALVAEQRRLMELLKEKRQAVISHAVTRGLNPAAPIKDSCIDWLGPVPAHWTVIKLGLISSFKGGAGFPDEYQGQAENEIPFFKVGDIVNSDNEGVMRQANHTVTRDTAKSLRAFIFEPSTIVFAKVGAALLLKRFRLLGQPSCIDNNMMGMTPCENVTPDFLLYALPLLDLTLIANPGAVPSINEGQISSQRIALPPLNEQAVITDYLDTETAKFDTLTAEAQRAIDLLQERRTALISAAVTGQIDLREIRTPS